MKNLFLITFLSLFLFNSSIANTNANNNENKNNLLATNINSAKIELIDNYLETIILNLVIKKIDLKLNILQAYKNDNSKVKSSFISKDSEFDSIDTLQLYKSKLQQQLTTLNNSLSLSSNNFVKLHNAHNDLNTTKLLNTHNFSLQQDNSEIIAFVKNYQQILKKQQQIHNILNKEIHQGKRSEFDIHFIKINELDNQIFLKKAAKIYFIEKLKQQPTIKNFDELNSYLINPIDANILKF